MNTGPVSARTLKLDRKTGSLTPGKQADVILHDLDALNVMPVNDAVSSAVLICNPSNVSWVFVVSQVKKARGQACDVDWSSGIGYARSGIDSIRIHEIDEDKCTNAME